MSVRYKKNDDDFKAKKVYSKIERNSKLGYAYKKRNDNKNISSNGKRTPSKRSKEVVIKITGASKNLGAFKRHIEYTSRDYELEIYDREGREYKGEDEIKEYINYFNDVGDNIPVNPKKEKREVMNLTFSMNGDNENLTKEIMLKAVTKTINEKYPNNESCFAFHGDTNNPHIHCDLKISGTDGKRIDLRITDIHNLREEFSRNLNDLGIEATATKKKEYTKNNTQKEREELHHEVVNFGKAKYQFEENEKESFYVQFKDKEGKNFEIWSKDLERVINDNQLVKGDFAKFKIVDKQPREVTIYKNIDGKRKKITKTTYASIWDVSIKGKNEKELKVMNEKTKKPTYKMEGINKGLTEFAKKKDITQTKSKGFGSTKQVSKFANAKKKPSQNVDR